MVKNFHFSRSLVKKLYDLDRRLSIRIFSRRKNHEAISKYNRARLYLRSVINSNFIARTRVQGEVSPPSFRLLVLGLASEDLYVDRNLLRGPTEKLVSAHGIWGIPASRRFDVLPAVPRPPGTPVRELASRASSFPRDTLLVQGYLEAVVGHGAVLACDELQDHVSPARVDARHPAATAEPGDLQDPAVHVFQKREIVAAAVAVARVSR